MYPVLPCLKLSIFFNEQRRKPDMSQQRSIRVELRAVMAAVILGQRDRPRVHANVQKLMGWLQTSQGLFLRADTFENFRPALPKWINAFRDHDGGRRKADFQSRSRRTTVPVRMVGLPVAIFARGSCAQGDGLRSARLN